MKNQNNNQKAKNCGNKNCGNKGCGKNNQKDVQHNYEHGGNND